MLRRDDEKERQAARDAAAPALGYDLVIGSDLFYAPLHFAALRVTITALLAPGGRAVLASSARGGPELDRGVCTHLRHFVSLVNAAGQLAVWSHGPLAPLAAGEVAIFHLRRCSVGDEDALQCVR